MFVIIIFLFTHFSQIILLTFFILHLAKVVIHHVFPNFIFNAITIFSVKNIWLYYVRRRHLVEMINSNIAFINLLSDLISKLKFLNLSLPYNLWHFLIPSIRFILIIEIGQILRVTFVHLLFRLNFNVLLNFLSHELTLIY